MKIAVGQGSCGIAAGAMKAYEVLESTLDLNNNQLTVTGCIGMCYLEPIVDIYAEDGLHRFVKVNGEIAGKIANAINNNNLSLVKEYEINDDDKQFLDKQTRIALRHCGVINPEIIEDYTNDDGYKALEKVITTMSPEDVIEEIKVSGLAGRGGAGFPTWFKWNAARQSTGEKKYLICNADEGDPGAFMDRAVIEGDPHNLIEGMLIGAYAIGATEAIVYVRAEYPLAIRRLQNAIDQARTNGFIGNNIMGTDFSCDFRIKAGAGAFVCGEETALIESLEGSRGMPRLKPPFPAQSGYWHKPSNINNVETFANVSWIILNGGNAFCNVTYFSDESFFISYIVNGFEEGQVAARTKCFTITGQYYTFYFCVSLHLVKCFVNAINQSVVHRVEAGRTIQGDGSNVVFYSIQYSVFH